MKKKVSMWFIVDEEVLDEEGYNKKLQKALRDTYYLNFNLEKEAAGDAKPGKRFYASY